MTNNSFLWALACILMFAVHNIICISFRFIRSALPHEQSEREAPPKGQTALTLLYGSRALRDAYGSIFHLYEGFCGPTHFRALSNLLGYQGIAMLLEELMNVVENQVTLGNLRLHHYYVFYRFKTPCNRMCQLLYKECHQNVNYHCTSMVRKVRTLSKWMIRLWSYSCGNRCPRILPGPVGSCHWIQGFAYWSVPSF